MEPHSAYILVAALPHDLDRDIRRRRDHDTVELRWYGSELAVTPCALHLRGVWVDGKCFVSRGSQLAKDGVGRLTWVPGDAGHSYLAPLKKRCDGFGSFDHLQLSWSFAGTRIASIFSGSRAIRWTYVEGVRAVAAGLRSSSGPSARRHTPDSSRAAAARPQWP